ncbi:hypothetical protein NQ315_005612 [Exocentrus adspersus]|uniref:Uncharacterized protein n=1 Tax=Exocentrus adspersus TaxID=1586481 RepID=A0AAV8VTB6_9CUCU|nr:hypothetical protein NQ315_005612 [Exocentrus adspersus]
MNLACSSAIKMSTNSVENEQQNYCKSAIL